MHAPPAPNKIQSHIDLCFGQKITTQSTPISISLIFDIFSQKNQNIRFNMQQMLNFNINDNTLLIELKVKQGYGSQLADKIITFLKTNETYQKMNKENKVQIKAVGKQDKCYLLILSQSFAEPFDQISKLCQQIQVDNSQLNVNNSIKLQIRSMNSCDYVRKLLDNQGSMRAAFDSLAVNFSFQKTKLVEKVLEKIFTQFQMPQIVGPLKGFNNLNLSLNFASSSTFDNYEQLRNFGKVMNKIETYLFTSIKGQYKEDIKFYYFNPVFSFTGKILAEQLETLLEALFEEPKKEN